MSDCILNEDIIIIMCMFVSMYAHVS